MIQSLYTMLSAICVAMLVGVILCFWKDWEWHAYRCSSEGKNPFTALLMNKRIISLSRNGTLRRWFRKLYLNRFYDVWLEFRPRVKKLPNNVVYRSIDTEGVSLALEMLEGGNCYPLDWIPFPVTTFADLGCNVGYFPCWLASQRQRDIHGIMIDANRFLVDEAGWHVRENGWSGIMKYCGLVGSDGPFYIAPSNTCSTAHLHKELAPKDWVAKCFSVSVGKVCVEQLWASHMRDARCNLLKVDIEGSEYEFLRTERKFMERVDAVLVECHTYVEPFSNAVQLLKEMGFGDPIIFNTLEREVVAGFLRTK